jgi:hypothetical protein
MNLNDFGVVNSGSRGQKKTENYKSIYMQEIAINDHIIGELSISPMENSDYGERFYIWVTNHEDEEEWVINIQNPYRIEENDKIYAKNGRLYVFLDSFFRKLLGEKYVERKHFTFDFDEFRENVNKLNAVVTVQAVESGNPKAEYAYFKVLDVELDD